MWKADIEFCIESIALSIVMITQRVTQLAWDVIAKYTTHVPWDDLVDIHLCTDEYIHAPSKVITSILFLIVMHDFHVNNTGGMLHVYGR